MTQTPDDDRETSSYKIADQKIENLATGRQARLPLLHSTGASISCSVPGRALMGSAEAIEMFEEIIIIMREHDVPAPDRAPSTATH
jgi:hypothetical protein